MERPGGGGRSHRPERRESDIAYLVDSGVRLVISTMTTRHGLGDYEAVQPRSRIASSTTSGLSVTT